jgi:hypothetical protein
MMFATGVRLAMLCEALSMTADSTTSTSGSVGLVLTTAGAAMPAMVSMSILALVSTLIGAAMSTMVSMSILALVSTLIGTAMLTMVSMSILAVVGDGAGESVDPDPVVPMVGAN